MAKNAAARMASRRGKPAFDGSDWRRAAKVAGRTGGGALTATTASAVAPAGAVVGVTTAAGRGRAGATRRTVDWLSAAVAADALADEVTGAGAAGAGALTVDVGVDACVDVEVLFPPPPERDLCPVPGPLLWLLNFAPEVVVVEVVVEEVVRRRPVQ